MPIDWKSHLNNILHVYKPILQSKEVELKYIEELAFVIEDMLSKTEIHERVSRILNKYCIVLRKYSEIMKNSKSRHSSEFMEAHNYISEVLAGLEKLSLLV